MFSFLHTTYTFIIVIIVTRDIDICFVYVITCTLIKTSNVYCLIMHHAVRHRVTADLSRHPDCVVNPLVFQLLHMYVATQFRKAIARRLAQISSCSESEALAALGTPKASLMQQFNIPLPRIFPKDRLPDAGDLADKVHFLSCSRMSLLNVYIYDSLVHVIPSLQTYLLLASFLTLV